MARDVTDPEGDETGGMSPGEGEFRGNSGLLNRRSYLKLAGSAAAFVGALGAAGTGAAADEYEVIEARGQTIHIGDGETWENKLIDMTTGGDISIAAHATNWTIRNVGFEGKNTSDTGTATFGVSDLGGNTSVVENVYLGDGSTAGNRQPNGHGQTAFWVNPRHSGHIDFRRLNIQGFADNAIYASAPGGRGGGTVHIDECYAANCYVSHYRLATAGSKVTNSVVRLDEEGYDGRGVWAWGPGPVEVENCVLDTNGRHYSLVTHGGGRVTARDTAYDAGFHGGTQGAVDFEGETNTGAEAYVPDGVPESAEEAAAGGPTDGDRESDAAEDLDNLLLIDGVGTDGVTEYEFSVSGAVEPATDRGATIDDGDEIDGTTVSGSVGGWRDAYRFSGDVLDFRLAGEASVDVEYGVDDR